MFGKIKKYGRKPIVWVYSKIIPSKPKGIHYGVISVDPPLVNFPVTGGSEEEFRKATQCVTPLFDCLRMRTAYFFCTWWWYTENDYQAEIVKKFEAEHAQKYPKHHFIHLCNTSKQEEVFGVKGLRAEFVNHNCLVDERIFRPLSSIKKFYDAVYDARLNKFKRHHLARNLRNLALIYPNWGNDYPADMRAIRTMLNESHYFNHGPDGTYQNLNPEEVNRALNACKVGLCLSRREGAMYASIQYLLCGLPVVSTRNQGGRDEFFDDTYVEIVDDDPESVRQGVQKMIQKDLSPALIRDKTLLKMNQHRKKFQALVQNIYQGEGVQRDFTQEWKDIYFNQLIKWQKLPECLKQFQSI